MTTREAIEYLAEGHSWWSVECAEEICKAFGFELPKSFIETYNSQHEANPTNDYKGLWLAKDSKFPVSGVTSYKLSNWVVDKLGLKVHEFFGRGSQARANAEAITKHFGLEKEEL